MTKNLLNALHTCLYFDSPRGLVKIQYNLKRIHTKNTVILHTKMSNEIYMSLFQKAQ